MMHNFNNVFKKNNIDDIDKQVAENIRMTADIAKECVQSEKFKMYKRQYEKSESKVLQSMLILTDMYTTGKISSETYAAKTLVYMTNLKSVRALLTTVENDARKK